MSVELLQNLSLTAFVASGALGIAAVIMFFALGIREVIGDLSGMTARRAIEDIRQQSKNNERRSYESMRFRMDKGRITDKISTKRLFEQANSTGASQTGAGTEVLQQNVGTEVLQQSAVTDVLQQSAVTVVLNQAIEQPVADFRVDVEIGFSESSEGIE